MPTYYKYAERNADSQVNWAEIGKGVTDMLQAETEIRRQKKAAIDESTRQFQKVLSEAPQGEFQDGNKFTNDFSHDMMAQMLLDTRLLKSGQMKLQDFTLRRQNYIDGTDTLFDLQKLYQENYKSTMEGLQSGDLQALTGYNMGSVEGFANFSKSKAVINPYTGDINVGIMKPNPITGIMELSKDVVPVNVIKGKLSTKIKAFKVDEAMNNTVSSLGKEKDYIYQLATTSRAGSITELMGPGAFENIIREHPELKGKVGDYKGIIDNFNSAIDKTIDGYFSDPYHISSVLTQNTSKYHQDSYTYDMTEAKKNSNKLLLKINPNTGLGILDETAPHYKEQVQEARDWVKSQLLSKLDRERNIKVTATTPYAPQQQQWQYDAANASKDKINASRNFAENLVNSLTGDPVTSAASTKYLSGKTGLPITKTKDSYVVENKETKQSQTFKLLENGVPAEPMKFAKAVLGSMGLDKLGLDEDQTLKFVKDFFGDKKINLTTESKGFDVKDKPQDPIEIYSEHIDNILPPDIIPKDQTTNQIQAILDSKLKGLGIKSSTWTRMPNGIFFTNNDGVESPVFLSSDFNAIKEWVQSNPSKNLETLIKTGVVKPSQKAAAPSGAPAPNAQGVGSKYGGG